MKPIDPYIDELLHKHDCVVVTDLGGFITNYQPCNLNTAINIASPASKKVAFNSDLKQNDGLLATHISEKEAMNYADACEVIKDYVKDAHDQLNDGRKLNIDHVGMLFLNNQKNIEFIPEASSNFLTSSFGLSSIHSPVIKKQATIQNKEVANVGAEDEEPTKKTVPFRRKKKWRVIEVVPAAAILASLIIAPPVLDHFNTNLGTLLPFSRINEFYFEKVKGEKKSDRKVIISLPSPFDIPPPKSTIENNSSNSIDAPVAPEETQALNTTIAGSVESEPINEAGHADHETSYLEMANMSKSYHIIGGCFRVRSNAENFVTQMKDRGVEATIIGQNNNGLFMVSLFRSGSASKIHDTLPTYRSQYIAGAWVTHR